MMKAPPPSVRAALLWLAALALCASPLHAQQQSREPRIGYVFPAGAKRGSTCEVIIGGRMLEGTKEALVSGSGVRAAVTGFSKPLQQKRFNELRDYLQDARKKAVESGKRRKRNFDNREMVATILKEAGATDDEVKLFIRQRNERNDPRRQQNPQLVENVTLQLEIAADAGTGARELRLLTPAGVSNPLVFCVGNLPELLEAGAKDDTSEASPTTRPPAVLNGRILPGEADHYTFQAQWGERIVVAVQARDLIPYLADAVPGWFQPVVTLRDAKQKEVAFADDYRFGPDPVLFHEVKQGGLYDLEIRDALYRGREDFIYRITVGAVPFVTGIFPLGGRAGAPATVDVAGVNLGRMRRSIVPAGEEGIHPVPRLANGFAVGDIAFAADVLPESDEHEPNGGPSKAQKVAPPVIINGRIDEAGDADVFSFPCKAGRQTVLEVNARRLNSPLDSWLKVTDSKGRQVAFNDDCEDKGSGLLTHHADSRLVFTAPADGVYFARLGDAQRKGGSDFAYRLRISEPRPDFALRVVPSGINARAGTSVPVTVFALRKDGFAGGIALSLKDAPEGFALEGGRIPAGADKIQATLACPQVPPDKPVSLAIEGSASIGKREITRRAVPADDMEQAFIYHHLVPAKQLLVAVTDGRGGRPLIHLVSPQPMKLPAGGVGQTVLSVAGRRPFTISETQAQLVNPPDGISIEGISEVEGGAAVSFRADAAKAKPGLSGNLIVEMFTERMVPSKNGQKREKKRWSSGLLPAISFEVVER